jgi:cell wall-associated NlpC family hydrolase
MRPFDPSLCLLFFFSLPILAVAQPKAQTHLHHFKSNTLSVSLALKTDSILHYAQTFLGKPYVYACADPQKGFDCSGFVSFVFGHFGIHVPRSSIDYGFLFSGIPSDSARPGDILVFTGTNASIRRAGHVGIVLSKPGQELRFIHSSSSLKHNGVVISSFLDSPYYKERFLGVVRVLE